jgi:hypothetical protein
LSCREKVARIVVPSRVFLESTRGGILVGLGVIRVVRLRVRVFGRRLGLVRLTLVSAERTLPGTTE